MSVPLNAESFFLRLCNFQYWNGAKDFLSFLVVLGENILETVFPPRRPFIERRKEIEIYVSFICFKVFYVTQMGKSSRIERDRGWMRGGKKKNNF